MDATFGYQTRAPLPIAEGWVQHASRKGQLKPFIRTIILYSQSFQLIFCVCCCAIKGNAKLCVQSTGPALRLTLGVLLSPNTQWWWHPQSRGQYSENAIRFESVVCSANENRLKKCRKLVLFGNFFFLPKTINRNMASGCDVQTQLQLVRVCQYAAVVEVQWIKLKASRTDRNGFLPVLVIGMLWAKKKTENEKYFIVFDVDRRERRENKTKKKNTA